MAGIRAMHGAIAEALALQAWTSPGTLAFIPAYNVSIPRQLAAG